MRITTTIALLGAAALLAVTSCKKDVANEVKPDYGQDVVNTTFAFTVATAQTPATKAETDGADEAQVTGAFVGMTDMKLVTLDTHPFEATTFSRNFNLSALASGAITDEQASKVYNLSIPTGTNNMLFYGRSLKNNDKTSAINNIKFGATTFGPGDATFATTKALSYFSLMPIQSAVTDFNKRSAALAAALNDIISASNSTAGSWASLVDNNDPLYLPLKQAYLNLTTIGANEFRLGSGPAVRRAIQDIYKIANDIDNNTSNPLNLRYIAEAIKGEIVNYVNITTFEFLSPSSISSNANVAEPAKFADLPDGSLNNFPMNLNLPAGSAQLTFDNGTKKFAYSTQPGTFSATYATSNVANITKYVYPSELFYICSSTIRVSEDEITAADYPVTIANWNADTWTGKTWVKDGTVHSTTRGVALQQNINYGNALLATTVSYNTTDGKLQDNRHNHTSPAEDNAIIDITTGSKFVVTGILIGGQPERVEFNATAAAGASASVYDYVVYDQWYPAGDGNAPTGKVITAGATGSAGTFYTKLFDNLVTKEDGTPDTQKDVVVALELRNDSGEDFWGADNLIRQGGTFYLAAKLNSSALPAVADLNYPVNTDGNGHRYPPVAAAAPHANVPTARIFMEDFKTNLTLKIGPTSLQHAYSTVPDLRSVEMTFGLSVDLTWETGASFDITL